ncbi:MAG: DEAD/DEAH box helicase family protein, partial [Desulfurococcales archaeon]|nr:DEAD/DEAH box helicase family protein [Desulfurococcales archaeon]
MKPRDYQLEAVEWALRKRQSIICMPTGTGKTLIAALWIKHLLKDGKVKKVLVLEPTRFLVEQTSRFLKRLGIPAEPVHGSMSRGARRRGWSSLVVVATPEIVESEGFNVMDEPGAIVVDECHHTTGQDSYVTVARRYRAEWRLGLTAYLPPSRRRMLEDYIGEARCWSWTDPRLAKYIPEWVGEVYEAPLNKAEERLYTRLEELWDKLHGVERVVIGNALRWLVRDGAIALRESYEKGGLLSRLLEPVRELLYSREVRPAHKLPTLVRILRDHEGYEKAIVFVDRVIVAELVSKSLRSLEPALILGRRRINPRISLEKAKRTRLIISTSAGEEGIDLPEADLLIIWSHTASPLRFIQRLGRILRPSRAKQKTAVFIA